MPTSVPLRVVRDCPVVDRRIVLSRDRVFMDYILLSESDPTCSNIHACLTQYGEIKNIAECLLHNVVKHFPSDDGAH